MGHDSSFIKHLRKKIYATAVIKEKTKMLEADIDKNID